MWARLLEDGLDIDKRAGCPGEGGNLSLVGKKRNISTPSAFYPKWVAIAKDIYE